MINQIWPQPLIEQYCAARKSILEVERTRDRPPFTLLLGAGASASSGVPLGDAFVSELTQQTKISKKSIKANFEELCKQPQCQGKVTEYQALMNLVARTKPDTVQRFVRKMISKAKRDSDGRWVLSNSHHAACGIVLEYSNFARMIFTTNFDPLLEYAFIQDWNTEPLVVRTPDEWTAFKPQSLMNEFPILAHLHGYWQSHQQYHDLARLTDWWAKWEGILKSEVVSANIVVVGYSGEPGSVAMSWLRTVLDSLETRRVFWAIRATDEAQFLKEEKRLRGLLGYRDLLSFVPIRSADEFLLDLAAGLGAQWAREISCLRRVFPWYEPSAGSSFASGAEIRFFPNDDHARLVFRTGPDVQPANNHAGLNIETIHYDRDLSRYSEIEIDYATELPPRLQPNMGFEFKLHGYRNAWSYRIPFEESRKTLKIPLTDFLKHGLDLRDVWRIVVAVAIDAIGPDASATIRIYQTRVIP